MNEILITNIVLALWLLLMLGFEGSRHNLLKQPMLYWRINSAISWAGLWHSWSMFAPQPLHSNRNIFARVVDPDGKELAVWTEPDWTIMNNGKPVEGETFWQTIKRKAKGKWYLFYYMRLRKIFSSCAEGRQWDMPLLLRQMCRHCEHHMIKQGIRGHSIALFLDLDYAPYFCPKDGIKDWKCNQDKKNYVIYVYECEKTTIENATYSKDRDAKTVHIPYSVRWEWERRNPINQGEEYWDLAYEDEEGNKWAPTISDQPEEMKRSQADSYQQRKLDNEFLDDDLQMQATPIVQHVDEEMEEYIMDERQSFNDPSNGGSI
tara:strand:+ start:3859 stop:4815 length:957 start_codon:yes stop_codon:yes gene_type:complete